MAQASSKALKAAVSSYGLRNARATVATSAAAEPVAKFESGDGKKGVGGRNGAPNVTANPSIGKFTDHSRIVANLGFLCTYLSPPVKFWVMWNSRTFE